ncbi:DUF2799 domain-containing protein [Brevundimonas vesicularis]|uniref:DUF2799 domain-containing protein n=1 Tax=Brevundimonas vesicularis TaxID=41276 RepID=UPI0038D4F7A6
MKAWMSWLVVGAGALLLGSCTTMSKDECLMGAWGQKGYQDGLSGYDPSRLDDHAEACAKHGVGPNPTAYLSAREDGLRQYCTARNGFTQGRRGNSYRGVCRPEEEDGFIPAYRDGLEIHAAEQALASAQSDLQSAIRRIRDRQDKLEAKQRELRQSGLTDQERAHIRERISEVRGEIVRARRDARDAQDYVAMAEAELRTVLRIIGSRHGGW